MKMRQLVALIVLVSATLLSSHPTLAQISQQKFLGTGAVRNAGQGASVPESDDGNTAGIRTNAQEMLSRIKKGEHPAPVEIRAWLLSVATVGLKVDPPGTDMTIVPVLQLMDKNYGTYEASVSSLFRDQSVVGSLRLAMLELIGRHWDSADSRHSLLTVFDKPADDAVLQGQISLSLARHGEMIGDKLMERYPSAPPEARFYYAQALAVLGRKDAASSLRDDARQTQSIPLRSASIVALVTLDPASMETCDLVDEILSGAKPVPVSQRGPRDLDNERVAMHAVQAVGQSDDPGTSQRLLAIACDETLAVDVRLTALESLAVRATVMPGSAKTALSYQVNGVRQRVTESPQLDELNRERFLLRIEMLQEITAPQSRGSK